MEEEFTVARLYISKMKSEVKTLVGRCGNLESASTEAQDKLHRTSSELSECKLHVQQVGGATIGGVVDGRYENFAFRNRIASKIVLNSFY